MDAIMFIGNHQVEIQGYKYFGLLTPKQWTIKLNFQNFTLQQAFITMEVKKNIQHMKKLIAIKVNRGENVLLGVITLTRATISVTLV